MIFVRNHVPDFVTDKKNWHNRFWKNVLICVTKWSFADHPEGIRASKNPPVTVDTWSDDITTALRANLPKIPVSTS